MIEPQRESFELAAHAHYLAQRQRGKLRHDFDEPMAREDLMWRKADGEYGVAMMNAAWWGWQAAAAGIQKGAEPTEEQWYDIASKYASRDWNGDAFLDLIKSVGRDVLALRQRLEGEQSC